MEVSPIKGLNIDGQWISEDELQGMLIYPIQDLFRKYFKDYGYEYVGVYDLDRNQILVKSNQVDLSILLANWNFYEIIDYTTGDVITKVVDLAVMSDVKRETGIPNNIANLNYFISHNEDGDQLIEGKTGKVVMSGEVISFITWDKLVVRECSIDTIVELPSMKRYPLIKQDGQVDIYCDEKHIDYRIALYHNEGDIIEHYSLLTNDFKDILTKYPYCQIVGQRIKLLDYEIGYGIRHKGSHGVSEYWYSSIEERDSIIRQINGEVERSLKNKVKVK